MRRRNNTMRRADSKTRARDWHFWFGEGEESGMVGESRLCGVWRRTVYVGWDTSGGERVEEGLEVRNISKSGSRQPCLDAGGVLTEVPNDES